MIPIVKADGTVELEFIRQLKKRSGEVDEKVNQAVAQIIAQVKERGDEAVREYTVKFDGRAPENLEISKKELKEAENSRAPELLDALRRAAENIADFHRRQVQQSWLETKKDGVILGQRIRGLQRVGLYVPGGKAVYPSSVIMNVVPAQAAGVESLAIATPPSRNNADGLPDKTILATCAILGVDEVYAVGGAQAVAMFAYGAKGSEPQDGEILCDPVDKITGPGNIFVATAKRMVSGIVGIDAVAGPTEIAIIADKGANPSWLAADLIGQAEHDELAGSVLITDSEEIAEQVQENLKYRVPRTEHSERVNTSLRGRQSGIILTDGIEQSIDAANAYAAEHLEVQTADPDAVIAKIRNAGAIFRGPYSPVPLGDYMSGSNHVLPTSGTARFASGLGVHTFMKPVEVIEYDEQGLKTLAARVNAFAVSEDLPAHGESVLSRFIDDPYNKETIKEQEEQAGLR